MHEGQHPGDPNPYSRWFIVAKYSLASWQPVGKWPKSYLRLRLGVRVRTTVQNYVGAMAGKRYLLIISDRMTQIRDPSHKTLSGATDIPVIIYIPDAPIAFDFKHSSSPFSRYFSYL